MKNLQTLPKPLSFRAWIVIDFTKKGIFKTYGCLVDRSRRYTGLNRMGLLSS